MELLEQSLAQSSTFELYYEYCFLSTRRGSIPSVIISRDVDAVDAILAVLVPELRVDERH